jgi:hypothetical protein
MPDRDREMRTKRETLFADSNDGAEVPSPDAEPLYSRQTEGQRDESRVEHEVNPTLPDSVPKLLEGLSHSVEEGGLLSYPLAGKFGALEHCDLCGRPMIEPPALSTALMERYRTGEENRAAFEDAIRRSGMELADDYTPNFCSYHAQVTSE